jgi:hypothetical protein
MARPTAYLFCRYQILESDNPLAPSEEWSVLEEARGKPIAYRKRDPTPDDHDTFLMRPRQKMLHGLAVHTWAIAQDVKYRERSTYDKNTDEISESYVETDEIRHTKFIAIPRLGVLAVDDSISERSLGARSAVGRFIAIIETVLEDASVIVNFAGTPQDTQRALESWTLDQFSFTVRPFNPTPAKHGEKLHELMTSDHVGSLRAIALPTEGLEMRDSHEGIISEAKGLSDDGYGSYGASGITPDGLRAKISKPKFSMDKQKTIAAQSQSRTLKVYIDKEGTLDEQEGAVVRALIDLYG